MHKWNKNAKILIIATFLLMILMRLVWIQIRDFQPKPSIMQVSHVVSIFDSPRTLRKDWQESKSIQPAYLFYPSYYAESEQNGLRHSKILKWNKWLFFTSCFFMFLCVKLLSGHLILSLSVAVALLSRGSLIDLIHYTDSTMAIFTIFSLWFFLFVYWLRSAALSVEILLAISGVIISILHPIFFLLILIPLSYLLISYFLRRPYLNVSLRSWKQRNSQNKAIARSTTQIKDEAGKTQVQQHITGLFHPIRPTLVAWVEKNKLWEKFLRRQAGFTLASALAITLAFTYGINSISKQFSPTNMQWDNIPQLLLHVIKSFYFLDIHSLANIIIIALNVIIWKNVKLEVIRELSLVLLTSNLIFLGLIMVHCQTQFVPEMYLIHTLRPFELIFVSLGLAGLFRLIKMRFKFV